MYVCTYACLYVCMFVCMFVAGIFESMNVLVHVCNNKNSESLNT